MAVDNIARGMAASALKNQGGGGSSLPIVNTAAIGQTIRVSAVDDAGKPTEWEAVEFPAGGGGVEIIKDITLAESVSMVSETLDNEYRYLEIYVYAPRCETNKTNNNGILFNPNGLQGYQFLVGQVSLYGVLLVDTNVRVHDEGAVITSAGSTNTVSASVKNGLGPISSFDLVLKTPGENEVIPAGTRIVIRGREQL